MPKTTPRTKAAKAKAPRPRTAPAKLAQKALPPALAANAQAARAASQARLRARGEAALELLREKVDDLAENILDIGAAVGELMAKGVPEALGYAGFDALCRATLKVHPETLRRWRVLATSLKRQFVISVGVARAEALLELCDATPADDAPEDLLTATLTLPSGAALVVAEATAEQLADAAKAYRQAQADAAGADGKGKPGRGFTTTVAERKAHGTIAQRLKKAPKAAHATTRLVAQRDGDGAKVVLEVRLPAWDATLALLAKR